MKNISIHNMRTNETSSENRLIKFFKTNSNSKVELSTNPQSVVLLEDGFEICLAPVIVPDICENAIQTVGISLQDILSSNLSWKISDISTNEVLVEGDINEDYQKTDLVEFIENSDDASDSHIKDILKSVNKSTKYFIIVMKNFVKIY